MFERGIGSTQNPLEYSPEPGFAPDLVRLAKRVGRELDPVARQMIARSHTYNTVQIELRKRLEQHFDRDPNRGAILGAFGKLTIGTFDPIRARIAMQIAGRAALAWEPDSEQGIWPSVRYLNSRLVSISGGTNEMQRNIIGERVLGLPREPSFDTKKPFNEVLRKAGDWK
jgi:alkylation response protein AidB-like acyl-CoA dehydrogenase